MRTQCDSICALRDAIEVAEGARSGDLIGVAHRTSFADLLHHSAIPRANETLCGRSVLIAARDPYLAALALIELDGVARRLVLCPPDFDLGHLPYVKQYAEIDAVISDGQFLSSAAVGSLEHHVCSVDLVPRRAVNYERQQSEWVLLTSGTTGRPKMVLHRFASLTGAISLNRSNDRVVWGTFYDIRRYGGLQIFLRALLTGSTLLLSGPDEPVGDFLQRAGQVGVTNISGTPSHWRRALMSSEGHRISPRYIRLSGEIADQAILHSLRSSYPSAQISHAFATTEAGVAFDVRDEQSGFPAGFLETTPDVEMKIVDSTLHVRSRRTADRYLGEDPPKLKDPDGFVDTGDVLELRDGRYYFQGRRDGVINVGGLKVHPEEVEAVINRHPDVRLSLVKMKKNSITGALVVADVQLKDCTAPEAGPARELAQSITKFCRQSLAPHKVPTTIRFVPGLAISHNGKLERRYA